MVRQGIKCGGVKAFGLTSPITPERAREAADVQPWNTGFTSDTKCQQEDRMLTLQEYKCPCCGGAIEFDSSLQKMKCPYCDTEFDMETLASYDRRAGRMNKDSMEWETSAGGEWQEGGQTDCVRTY